MTFVDRRRFLLTAAAALPALRSFAQGTLHNATIVLHPDVPGAVVPANFIGLSYETQQLTDPNFFAVSNAGLVTQFRALASNGVLRIGGNTSDIGWWKATSSSQRPPLPASTIPGAPIANFAYPITPEAIRNLRGFLDATGWTCIYGINLATNTPARAAEEAAFVTTALGEKLEYFQLGNEPDLYAIAAHLRDEKTWTAERYLDEWFAEAHAIRARVPQARFGMPDTGGWPDWYAPILARLLATQDLPSIAAFSHHYYIGGPPANPKINLETILNRDPRVMKYATDVREMAAGLSDAVKRTVPYRMTEGNTCYQGGKPGVSDVFAASLWAADYVLELASLGYAGVNLHGGDGKAVANSLGGKLPGEALMADPSAPHPRPFYTPIAYVGGRYVQEPVFFGLKFAAAFAGATMIPIDFDPGPVNATGFAAKLPNGVIRIAVINKDATQDLRIELPSQPGASPEFQTEYTLSSPALTSTEVTLAGAKKSATSYIVPRSSATIFVRRSR